MEKLNTFSAKQNELNESTGKLRSFIDTVVDDRTFVEVGAFSFTANETFEGKTFDGEGVITGYGLINSIPCYLYAQNGDVLKGGFGKAQADKIVNIIDMAIKTGTPVISILNSEGARIGEGVTVLEGYSKVAKKMTEASGVIPQISIVNGNVYGQNSLLTGLSDISIFMEKSLLSASSAMLVSANTDTSEAFDKLIGEKTHAEKSGVAALVLKKGELKGSLTKILDLLLLGGEISDADVDGIKIGKSVSAKEGIDLVVDSGSKIVLFEKYESGVQTVLARVGGVSVGIIAVDGFLTGGGARKAGRFQRFLDNFNIPLISIVNSEGVKVKKCDEENGIIRDLSSLAFTMADTTNAKISLVINACGAAYSYFASKCIGFDYSLAFADAVISTVPSSVGADIFFEDMIKEVGNSDKTRAQAKKRYEMEMAGAIYSAQSGYVDNIIDPSLARPYIISSLSMLKYKSEGPKFLGNFPL